MLRFSDSSLLTDDIGMFSEEIDGFRAVGDYEPSFDAVGL